MPIRAAELLAAIGVSEIQVDNALEISGVASNESAQATSITFFEGKAPNSEAIKACSAGLIFLPQAWQDAFGQPQSNWVFTKDPAVAFIKAQRYIPELNEPRKLPAPKIAPDAQVHPSAVIADGAQIGAQCVIGPNACIGAGVVIGERCVIDPCAVIYSGVRMGSDCRVMANASIGSDGFGWRVDDGRWLYFPQIGGVEIGNDVHIGANTAIDCGTLSPTIIGTGVRLDNQIHIAHNCQIGDYTAIAGCTGIAGSTRIGKWCLIGGSADILGHIRIGDKCTIQGTTFVARDMQDGETLSSALPGKAPRIWARTLGYINRLDQLNKRVRRLEAELDNQRVDK